MRECIFTTKYLYIFLSLYLTAILVLLFFTPFTYTEANILYSPNITLESFLVQHISRYLHSPWGMRLPFFLLSLGSIYLYRKLLEAYFTLNDSYYNLSFIIFLLIPGVTLSFIIVNYATIPIFLTLLVIYAYKREYFALLLITLVLLFFTHSAQFVLYLALALYSLQLKRYWLIAVAALFIILSSAASKYGIDGVPRGHLIQLIGIYAAIFSPMLFLAVVYALYKVAIKGSKDILWYIAATAFSTSILLSIRQAIKITDFAPFIVIAVPLVVLTFKNSLAVRLKIFRKIYYWVCYIILIVLLLETLILFLHYPLYKISPSKEWLLDTSIYKVPQIVENLKKDGRVCKKDISLKGKALYRYYGIRKCH